VRDPRAEQATDEAAQHGREGVAMDDHGWWRWTAGEARRQLTPVKECIRADPDHPERHLARLRDVPPVARADHDPVGSSDREVLARLWHPGHMLRRAPELVSDTPPVELVHYGSDLDQLRGRTCDESDRHMNLAGDVGMADLAMIPRPARRTAKVMTTPQATQVLGPLGSENAQ